MMNNAGTKYAQPLEKLLVVLTVILRTALKQINRCPGHIFLECLQEINPAPHHPASNAMVVTPDFRAFCKQWLLDPGNALLPAPHAR